MGENPPAGPGLWSLTEPCREDNRPLASNATRIDPPAEEQLAARVL
jgi:hypothetical protein